MGKGEEREVLSPGVEMRVWAGGGRQPLMQRGHRAGPGQRAGRRLILARPGVGTASSIAMGGAGAGWSLSPLLGEVTGRGVRSQGDSCLLVPSRR